jgi:hypothetical protein
MSLKRTLAAALVVLASLVVGVSMASAQSYSSDPVPGWLVSQQVINGVKYLCDDAQEGEWDPGFPVCDEQPNDGESQLEGICIDNVPYNYISDDFDAQNFADAINQATDDSGKSYGHTAAPCVPPILRPASNFVHSGPDRYIFCAVAGNTDGNGNPIAPGTSLNLFGDQPTDDAHYKGATPGFWVPGEGATCSLTPAQAALAAASTTKVNHVGGTGDANQPEIYTLVG